ncbi:MAG: hypothetical protein N2572_01290 [Syntrophales bacterium]|nr:hypothetical protein [Syntrophales bacterium]
MKYWFKILLIVTACSCFGMDSSSASEWLASGRWTNDFDVGPAISRTQHFYEILPRRYFPDIDRWEDITRLHDGGIKFSWDENFMFRLSVKGISGLSISKRENLNFAFHVNYLFDRGKVWMREHKEVSSLDFSPGKSEENARFFSYLLPAVDRKNKRLFTLVLQYRAGKTDLTRENREVLKGLFQYLKRNRDVFIVITGTVNDIFKKREENLILYMIRVGKVRKEMIIEEGKGDGNGYPWVEVKLQEERICKFSKEIN